MTVTSGNILPPTLRNTLLAIKGVQRGVDVTTLRLATGLKVNSALDNPQNFFNAKSLSNRASDLSRLLDGINVSVRTIEEAIHGTEAIEKLLDQAEAIALTTKEELQSGVNFPDLSNVEEEIVNISPTPLMQQINNDAPVAYFRLDGDTVEQTGNPLVSNGNAVGGVSLAGPSLYNNGSGAASANFDGINDGIMIPDSNDINLQTYNARTVELVFNADDVASRQVLYEEGAGVNGFTIYIDADGSLRVTAEDDAGGNRFADLDISSIEEFGALTAGETYHAAFVFDSDNNAFTGYLNGVNIGSAFVFDENFPSHSGNIGIGYAPDGVQFHDGESGGGFNFDGRISDVAIYNRALTQQEIFSHGTSLNSSTTIRYINTEYDTVLSQIDNLIEDAHYRGINLLKDDDLTTYFNEDRSNTLETEGTDFSQLGLGLERFNFTIESDVDAILDDIREARNRVRRFGSTLATDLSIIKIRNNFTRETINHLTNGADDLTVADQNEEGANLLALQTRQAVATSVLALNGANAISFLL